MDYLAAPGDERGDDVVACLSGLVPARSWRMVVRGLAWEGPPARREAVLLGRGHVPGQRGGRSAVITQAATCM